MQFQDVAHEASAIATFVDNQINKEGRQPGEILVLAQRRTIGNPIHAALKAHGVPSKSYYQESELDSEVAQERLAIFKLFVNKYDRIALRWLLGMGSSDFVRNPTRDYVHTASRPGKHHGTHSSPLLQGRSRSRIAPSFYSASERSRTSCIFSANKLVPLISSIAGSVPNSPAPAN